MQAEWWSGKSHCQGTLERYSGLIRNHQTSHSLEVKLESAEACEIVIEESHVGEHLSNAQVEDAIRVVQTQVRTCAPAEDKLYGQGSNPIAFVLEPGVRCIMMFHFFNYSNPNSMQP